MHIRLSMTFWVVFAASSLRGIWVSVQTLLSLSFYVVKHSFNQRRSKQCLSNLLEFRSVNESFCLVTQCLLTSEISMKNIHEYLLCEKRLCGSLYSKQFRWDKELNKLACSQVIFCMLDMLYPWSEDNRRAKTILASCWHELDSNSIWYLIWLPA